MKAELMALALLFAFVGFINSQLGPGADDKAAQSLAFLSDGAKPPWMDIDTLWQPTPEVQALLFGLQAAIGCVMAAYFLRYRKKSRDPEWD